MNLPLFRGSIIKQPDSVNTNTMKKWIFLICISSAMQAAGQDYLIDFTGSKMPVNTVIVENLTTGESLVLNGTDILNLKGVATGTE